MIGQESSYPRVAVVGCGQWGQNLVRNFSELGALCAICDQDVEKASALAHQHGVEVRCEEAILLDPEIEAVVIATEASLHAPQAERALAAGKHVYLEKPMVLSLRDATSLTALANKKGKVLMVGHILHYHPGIVALKERLSDLGNLKHIYSNRLGWGRFRSHEGVLWDLASHDVSLVLGLTQQMPETIQAVGQSYLMRDKPASSLLFMTFPEGLTAHIHVSWISPFKEQKFVVVGDKGMAVFDDQKPWEEKLTFFPSCVVWKDGFPSEREPLGSKISLVQSEPLKNECRHFLSCIKEGKTPLTCGEEGTRITDVLEKAQKSLESLERGVW